MTRAAGMFVKGMLTTGQYTWSDGRIYIGRFVDDKYQVTSMHAQRASPMDVLVLFGPGSRARIMITHPWRGRRCPPPFP